LRSPSLLKLFGDKTSDWRIYLFTEGGRLWILDPLPQQQAQFDLASFGAGTSIHLFNHFNGSIDLGVPLGSQSQTRAYDPCLTFRLWGAF